MFIEWEDSWGQPQLSYLPFWKGIYTILVGYGKWVPRWKIIIDKDK